MTALLDTRRITEHDADYQRVHARTVDHLTRSLDELGHDLRRGDPMAQSAFIQRHTDILYLAYLAAHADGQRDYWQTVSLKAAKTTNPDQTQTRRRMQFFLTSVAKMAHEALQALQKPKAFDEGDLNDWQQQLPIRIGLQADLTWSAFNDGYIDAGNLDNARPYLRVWWDLEPTARHCYDCPEYAKGSPYTAPGTGMYGGNELDATPGDGHTACGAACKCSLSYGPGIDTEVTDWGSVFPVDAPLDEIWPEELPSLTLGMPGNEAMTTMQKAALDDFRDAWDEWDQVRDGNPELPEMFDANFQKNSGINTLWERLTELQQQALFKVMEALKAWQDAGGGMQMAEMGQGYLLYSPDQARVPKGAPGGGRFAPSGKSKPGVSAKDRQQANYHERRGNQLLAQARALRVRHTDPIDYAVVRERRGIYEKARKARVDAESTLEFVKHYPNSVNPGSLEASQQRLVKAQAAERRALRALVATGSHDARETQAYHLEAAGEAAHAKASLLRGGSGAIVHFYEPEGQAQVAAVLGHAVSREDLAALTGARAGERVKIFSDTKQFSITHDGKSSEATFVIKRTARGVELLESSIITTGGRSAASGRDVLRTFKHVRAMGITHIVATAARNNGMNGYYTWARLGFTGKIPGHVLSQAQTKFGKITRVEQLMKKPGGAKWWKEHGDSWHATFDFRDGSASRKVYDKMVAALGGA